MAVGAGISWKNRFAITFLVILAACSPLSVLGPDRAIVTVGSKRVTVAAPSGFCVEPESLRTLSDGVFLLLTDCPRQGEDQKTMQRAAMTVHLSPDALFLPEEDRLDTLDRLGKFLMSKDGRKVLSRNGNAADITAEGSTIRNDALFIYVTDSGGPRLPGTSKNYWRGFTEIADGLVSLTVYGFDAKPLSKSRGLAYANALVVSLVEANPKPDQAP